MLNILYNELYLLALISAFVIGKIIKEQEYMVCLYSWLTTKYTTNKIVLFFISAICGILPIEGRITVSAPLVDSIVKQDAKSRSKMGVIDYLATHHYYFWSPVEPSVVIFLTALGMSWLTFLQYTIPLILTYFTIFGIVLAIYVKNSDLLIIPADTFTRSKKRQSILCCLLIGLSLIITIVLEAAFDLKTPLKWTFPIVAFLLMVMTHTTINQARRYINWWIIAIVAIIIAGGTHLQQYYTDIQTFIKFGNTIPILLLYGFAASFALGSSSKYAGIGAIIIITIDDIRFFPLVLAIEYAGYILSPTHKCVSISKLYFNTNTIHLVSILVILSISLITVAGYPLLYLK